jgi:uncharacterized damage-inducible protein DinB
MTIDELVQEFEVEAKTTRRVLERVPSDKLAWTPHAKSMSLGKLAMHLATAPAAELEVIRYRPAGDGGGGPPVPTSTDQILAAHDSGIARVKENLAKIGDAGLTSNWTASMGGKPLMSMRKAALLRALLMNHTYHHRGQLSVYLRLLDVPVPPIYGPSADESPFK